MANLNKSHNFSVIITCYNKSSTIQEAIDSARNQLPAVEIIVVDDGSSDGSREILRNCNADQVILHDKNKGALSAYLTGFRSAKGKYLVMLDGDDSLVPGILPALEDIIDERTCIRMGMAIIDRAGSKDPVKKPLRRMLTFYPGNLFTISQNTGGAAYIFPNLLFKEVDERLFGNWPVINVQDHIIPGLIGLISKRFIKLSTVGYYQMEPLGKTQRLSDRLSRLHHDRLLSDEAILKAAEGTFRQGFLSLFLLRAALLKRIKKMGKIYGVKLPSLRMLWVTESSRSLAVKQIANKIMSSGTRI
jgi:glycosyltransferase involved in cell wall biosynthesis